MRNSKDTPRSVKVLVKKLNILISKSIGAIKTYWSSFLSECNEWLASRVPAPFVSGTWYDMTFIGDSDLYTQILVTKRTKCFIHFIYDKEIKRAKIRNYRGVEYFYPAGDYSMAPSCDAK